MFSGGVPRGTADVRLRRHRHAQPATAAAAQRSVRRRRRAAAADQDAATDVDRVDDGVRHYSCRVFFVQQQPCRRAGLQIGRRQLHQVHI